MVLLAVGSLVADVGDLIKYMVGSQWVMVSKGVVGVGVGDVVVGGRRRSMRWASDCHCQLSWRRHFANDIVHEKGLGKWMGELGRQQ
jgi:hypothetical protein